MPKHYLTSMARKCDSIHRPEISLTSMSRKCDSMDNTTQVGRPARRNFCLPASRPSRFEGLCRTSQTPIARHHKKRPPRICRCVLAWLICATTSLSQDGYGQQQHRKGRPTWWIPGWAPGRRAAAAPATSTRLSGPACENKLGPKTFLERRARPAMPVAPKISPPAIHF